MVEGLTDLGKCTGSSSEVQANVISSSGAEWVVKNYKIPLESGKETLETNWMEKMQEHS